MFYQLHLDGKLEDIQSFYRFVSVDGKFDFEKVVPSSSRLTKEDYAYFENQELCDRFDDAYNHLDFDRDLAIARKVWHCDSNVRGSAFLNDHDLFFIYEGKEPASDLFTHLVQKASDFRVSCQFYNLSPDYGKYSRYYLQLDKDEFKKVVFNERYKYYTLRKSVHFSLVDVHFSQDDVLLRHLDSYEIKLGKDKSLYFDCKNKSYAEPSFAGYAVIEQSNIFMILAKHGAVVRYGSSDNPLPNHSSDDSMISIESAFKMIHRRELQKAYYKAIRQFDNRSPYTDSMFLLLSEKQQKLVKSVENYCLYHVDTEKLVMYDRFLSGSREEANKKLNELVSLAKSYGFGQTVSHSDTSERSVEIDMSSVRPKSSLRFNSL